MYRNTTYKEKFVILKDWLPTIFDTVKKDLRNEHLKQDPQFLKNNFPGKQAQKLTVEELQEGYSQAIAESPNGEAICEYIVNRWLLKHGDIYHLFEQELTKISPQFTELTEISSQESQNLISHAVKQFGAPNTYIFSVLNSVVFPESVFTQLNKDAHQSMKVRQEEQKVQHEHKSQQDMIRSHETEIARLTDKYEKKLVGMQKKYQQDTDNLKKQIATLQRKLDAKVATV